MNFRPCYSAILRACTTYACFTTKTSMRLSTTLIAFFFTAYAAVAFAEPAAKTSNQSVVRAQSSVALSNDLAASASSIQQLEVLREQNKLIREYQGSLLDTVYWALTGVVTLAVLLTGVSWWSNFRVYESDKRRLKEEIEARLKEYEGQATIREQGSRQASEMALDTKLDSLQTRLSIELSEIRQEASSVRTELTNAIKQASEPAAAAMEKIQATETAVAQTMADLRHVEEYVWDLRGNVANILITQGQGLTAAVEADNSFYIENVLKRMKATIKDKVLAKNLTLNPRAIEVVKDRLKIAENKRPHDVAELRDLVAQIKVADSPNAPPQALNGD